MDRILKSYIKNYMDSTENKENKESKQFELFSVYCVVSQLYSEIFSSNDIVIGNGNDCGIDGLAIIANGTLITTVEEVDDLIELNKCLNDIQFIFIQAKSSSKFSGAEIGTFGTGVIDFFREKPMLKQNDAIKEKHSIVDRIFQYATKFKENPTCYMYYVTTGKWVGDQNCEARINSVVQDLEDVNLFRKVNFVTVDNSKLQKYYRDSIDAIQTKIIFSEKLLLPDIPNVEQSYLGYIAYEEFLKLITSDSGEIRKSIFYDNVRDYQGENVVNQEIAQTIQNAPNKFILLNNGVTIICKNLNSFRNEITLIDYQIVNGCQTSHVLFNNRNFLEEPLYIPIKIIVTKDEDTVNNIIKANNSQTQVSNEQLVALNEFHRKLESYYQTFEGKDRLYYERRSKQYLSMTDIEKVRIVTIGTQIRATAAMFFDKPHLASRYYGRLLKMVDGIFNEEHSLLPYYTSAYLLYKLEYLFRNKALDSKYRKFRYHILMILKYDIAQKKIPPLNSKKIDEICKKILIYANDNQKLTDKVKEYFLIIDNALNKLNSNDAEATKSATLVEELKKIYIKIG